MERRAESFIEMDKSRELKELIGRIAGKLLEKYSEKGPGIIEQGSGVSASFSLFINP